MFRRKRRKLAEFHPVVKTALEHKQESPMWLSYDACRHFGPCAGRFRACHPKPIDLLRIPGLARDLYIGEDEYVYRADYGYSTGRRVYRAELWLRGMTGRRRVVDALLRMSSSS